MIDINNCKLMKYPAKILSQKALPVEKIDEDIRLLADKMLDIMVEANGVGLAAPQANVSLRMFVVSLEGTKEGAMFFINPQITPKGSIEPMEEGCLSVPGIYTNISRPSKVEVTALDLEGNEFTMDADGVLAKCIQHENDHIEGKTIIDRMTKLGKFRYRKTIAELLEQGG